VLAGTGAATLACAAGLASAASQFKLLLVRGDEVAVKGTPLHCIVETDGHGHNTLVCFVGTPAAPVSGDYGFSIEDLAAGIAAITVSSAKFVDRVNEPAVAGAQFTGRGGPARVYTVSSGEGFAVGGTSIACGVGTQQGGAVVCAPWSVVPTGHIPVGSYGVAVSSSNVELFRQKSATVETVLFTRHQPSAKSSG
jgi:hypothetical protein